MFEHKLKQLINEPGMIDEEIVIPFVIPNAREAASRGRRKLQMNGRRNLPPLRKP